MLKKLRKKERSKAGCRIRISVGREGDEMFAAPQISTINKVDHQFYYPGRNKVINQYKNIKSFNSRDSGDEKAELVYSCGSYVKTVSAVT